MEQEKELQRRKANNLKIYPLYRTFALDLFFYYAIIYLFLTIEKKITPAQVLQFEACYIFFKFISQIPCTLLIQKIGKRNSLVVANLILVIHILVIMFAANFEMLLVSQLLCAIGYIIKSTCESDMLYDSLEHNEKRGVIFSKQDGSAYSRYYYIDAITAIVSGFMFVVNPYLPLILCTMILIAVFFFSTKFEEVQIKREKVKMRNEFKNLKISFRQILQSKRLRTLLIFNAVFIGTLKSLTTLRNNTLTFIGVPEQYFGVIFAIMGIISGIASKNQWRIHKKYRNTTLGFLSIPTVFSCMLLGFTLLCNFPYELTLTIILILFGAQYALTGPYYISIKQYLNNFTNSEKRVKISTAKNIIENLIASVILFAASAILDVFEVKYTLIIVGGILAIAIVLLLDYMRGTVGLKMEDYGKKEII